MLQNEKGWKAVISEVLQKGEWSPKTLKKILNFMFWTLGLWELLVPSHQKVCEV